MALKSTDKIIKIDEESFERLFQEYFSILCSFANYYLKDFENSKEIVHELFLKIWEEKDTTHIIEPVKTYLFTTLHSNCISYIRSNKKFISDIELERMESEDFSESSKMMQLIEIKTKTREAITLLPKETREIFILNKFKNLKFQVIATKLETTLKNIEHHMANALNSLHNHLNEYIT